MPYSKIIFVGVLKLGDFELRPPRLDFPAEWRIVHRHSAEAHRQIKMLFLLRDFDFIRAGRLDEGNLRAFNGSAFLRLESPFLLQPEIGFNRQFSTAAATLFGFGHGLGSLARESALSFGLLLRGILGA
jgi:hypothetical protein